MNVQSLEKNPYIQNPLIAPIIHFHGKVVSTFNDLPQNGKVLEVAMRIVILVVSPFAYLVLGISALIGLAYHALHGTNVSDSASSQLAETKQNPSSIVCTIPRAFAAMSSQWSLKEVVRLLSISRESPFVREYLNTITPVMAAEKEGIDLDALIKTFKGKSLCSGNLSFEGRDLVVALDEAIKVAIENPSQGFKRMWAALLAMKVLQESIAANVLEVQHVVDNQGEERRAIDGFMDIKNGWRSVSHMVEVLYRFASTGRVEGEFIEKDDVRDEYSPIKWTVVIESASKEGGLSHTLGCLKVDDKLPKDEKEILCKTLGEVIKFAPYFLEENTSFQQLQDENLQKWNDKFKNIVTKDSNVVAQKLRHHRIPLYHTTKDACVRGFFIKNKLVELDRKLNKEMVQGTELCSPHKLPSLTSKPFTTVFEVVDEDTIDLTKRYKDQDANLNPVALNLANAHIPGGGVGTGEGAQEESLFRRSNYHQALCPRERGTKDALYPIPEDGTIYTPNVQIFRTKELDYTQSMDESDLGYEFHIPYPISFIAAAHVELRMGSLDKMKELDRELSQNKSLETRANLERICDGVIQERGIEGSYEHVTKAKMRAILRTAFLKGHKGLVLGALGCGAFANPSYLNATYWREVFDEPEFQGRFKKVGFAIRSFGSQHLINNFKSIEALNKPIDLEGTD